MNYRRSVLLRSGACVAALVLFAGCRPDPGSPPAGPPEPGERPDPITGTALVVGPDSVAGWWDGEAWQQADGPAEQIPAEGGARYHLIRLDEPIETALGGEPGPGCETNPGTSRIEIPGVERDLLAEQPPRIAVSDSVPEPRPRRVEPGDVQAPGYREAAAELLADRGINDPEPAIVQATRVDLEGDGSVEVVVVAERLADPLRLFAQVGDYSLVFVYRNGDAGPSTEVVLESIPQDQPGVVPFIMSHRLSAAADLNGDGLMELAVSLRYYEGAAVLFFALQPDGSLDQILHSTCGA